MGPVHDGVLLYLTLCLPTGPNVGTPAKPVLRQTPMAPPGGRSNLDAHQDRFSIIGAHAVEFSKTAKPLSKGFPSEGDLPGPASVDAFRANQAV